MSEILAPAGGKESALAAINAGADAIYLGLDRFSARDGAENFAESEFLEICRCAHALGVKVYAALNTLVKDDELQEFFRHLSLAVNGGADAIILQDLLLGMFIKEKYPELVLHLSTQAGTCNEYGARLAKEYGFDRVILARETKLKDIREIAAVIETEVFVQGALCTCFSGQCYLSSFAGGNSGNRGKCKQPCRKLYSIDRKGFENMAYRLSLSDLCAGENVLKLQEAGVSSFKIEGRMRRPEYVSAAVNYYKILLGGLDGKERALSDLKRTFNRGNYTHGLAFGQDKSFLSAAVQGHIGEFVGVIKVENGKFLCRTDQKFTEGDGFKILRDGKEAGGGAFGGNAKGGFIFRSRDRLKNGDKVFVTTDSRLNARLLSAKRTLPLHVTAEFLAGKRAQITLNGFKFSSEQPLERAERRPLTAEDIKTCFGKVDQYPFAPSFGEIVTDGVFLAASQLNALRREIYVAYYENISRPTFGNVKISLELPEILRQKNDKTAVICSDFRGLKADIGILKPSNYDRISVDTAFCGEKFLYVPPFVAGDELQRMATASDAFDGIYCDGYFGLALAHGLGKKFFAGTGWNIANRAALQNCTADYVCLSKELTTAEGNALAAANVFTLTAGNVKVMDLIYCPFGKKCESCDRRSGYTLTDESGRKFPLRRYETGECRFELYNCADLVAEGTAAGKLYDLTLGESRTLSAALARGVSPKELFKNYTRGHSNSRIL